MVWMSSRTVRSLVIGIATLSLGLPPLASAQTTSEPEPVSVPAFPLPYSSYSSPEAIEVMERGRAEGPLPAGASIEDARKFYGVQNDDRLRRMLALYKVRIEEATIGGVKVHRVTPATGVATENRGRILVNLHGGAFMWGSGSGALIEAIPIADAGRIEVITVDYRLAPENRFPAASEDVAAVYKVLLGTYSPQSIGLYGCSAGGYLTAESVAWFLEKGLPAPGAIGTFCASLVEFGGDSMYFAAAATGQKPDKPLKILDTPYLIGARAEDPLVFPGVSPELLKRFPPTLLISGTRDFAMSSVLHSNELLRSAGVETELRIWDGMPHAFFVDPESAESKQAYRAIADFFDRHLVAAPASKGGAAK